MTEDTRIRLQCEWRGIVAQLKALPLGEEAYRTRRGALLVEKEEIEDALLRAHNINYWWFVGLLCSGAAFFGLVKVLKIIPSNGIWGYFGILCGVTAMVLCYTMTSFAWMAAVTARRIFLILCWRFFPKGPPP